MKHYLIALPVLLLPALASAHGPQRHSRVQWGVSFGTGYHSPYYSPYYSPFYSPHYSPFFGSSWPGYWGPSVVYSAPLYTPPPVVIQSSPPVYIERPSAEPPATAYWYYCAPTKAYYPYVSDCTEAWQRVPPVPPSTPR